MDKKYAGKGVGKKLMDVCINKAKEISKQTIWLSVWEHNITAIKFYKRQGFYTVDSKIVKTGLQEYTNGVMIKRL